MAKTTLLLIVDDNPADSDYIKALLNEVAPDRFDILVAENIEQTLTYIVERDVEIITLDLYLPDSNGIGTLLSIRAKAPDVPVVIVSGLNDTKVTKEALFYGAQSYLVKGDFDGAKLLDAMVQAMTKQTQKSLEAYMRRVQRDLQRTRESFKLSE
jgi:DNA-binding NarL/FixJ family response regulator